MDGYCRARLYRHEPLHQSRLNAIRLFQRRAGLLAHAGLHPVLRHHGQSARQHVFHAILENPSQPQRHRHACHDVHILFRHASAAGNRRHAQLHVLHLAGHLFIFHFKRKNYVLHPSHFGYGLYRRYPVAQPIFSRRTGICRAGQFGRRRHVWLGIFAGARTLAFGRTGLARGVLPLAYRPDYGRSLEHHHRLASADRVFPALSGQHRHLRHDCTIGHDPRLQGRQEIYRCLAFLPDRRFLRTVRRTAFRR